MVDVEHNLGGRNLMTNTRYIVLSDTPMLMGEAELELDEAAISKYNREKSVAITNGEPPVNVAEVEPSEAKSNANRHWLYALIPLGLLAVFYFMRKKRK
jgi:hypothetical protein